MTVRLVVVPGVVVARARVVTAPRKTVQVGVQIEGWVVALEPALYVAGAEEVVEATDSALEGVVEVLLVPVEPVHVRAPVVEAVVGLLALELG